MTIYQVFQTEIDSRYKALLSHYPLCQSQNVPLYTNMGFSTPRIYIDRQIIYIYPDFLEYLWSFCFSFWVFGEGTSEYQIYCNQHNIQPDTFLPPNLSQSVNIAYQVSDHFINIINNNPSQLPISYNDIQQALSGQYSTQPTQYQIDLVIANNIFLNSLMLLIEHELSHYEFGQRPSKFNFITKKYEKEADLHAIRQSLSRNNNLSSALCCAAAFAADFCCTKKWDGIFQKRHPHIHKRVLYCMKEIEKLCSPQVTAEVAYRTVLLLVFKLDLAKKKFSSYDAGNYVYKYFKKIINEINFKLKIQRILQVFSFLKQKVIGILKGLQNLLSK